ncbi:glycerophosphodiester phosphodiesterase family protein [Sphingobacterium yanglingense]|uniref:Glycerophosphoryl diester phosphodiesterase n=1 Tax=Sphingobacterium yanglingense TaxID=1437280 RepID=A0A4V3DE79_9SPHI|nr:glycerophosphodiester phosphodiesterase family protein [Sphingobacterium yanglingense]TDQ80059.1 glycerophosphoryl diester phosphodiesterase [Sphingobacterium yanglingense]
MTRYFRYLMIPVVWSFALTVYGQSQILLDRLAQQEFHIAAHRGAHNKYPENSIASLQEAIRLGVSIVEIDLRSTKDGVLILMHDKTVDRTTTGKGKVSDLTYAEISALNLRETAHGAISAHKIPTFQEALAICKNKCIIDIDFKEENRAYIRTAFDQIVAAGMQDQVLFFLYDYKDMASASKLNKEITLFPRANNMQDLNAILKEGRTKIIHIDESFTDIQSLSKLKEQGIYLWLNSLGEVDQQALSKGKAIYADFLKTYPFIRIIQTDHPEIWRDTL